jgi:hypothetical protein
VHRALAISLVMTACGDNASPCSYRERDDVDNDTTAEVTGLAIGDATLDVCGQIDGGHAANGTLDVDRFRVAIAGSDMLFRFAADDTATALPSGIELRVFDTAVDPTLLADLTFDANTADHAATLVELPSGDYDVVVSADATGDLSGSIGYRLEVSGFDFHGCAPAARSAYTEAGDGDASIGNDVVAVDYAADPQFAAMAGTPEPTRLALAAGSRNQVAGSAAETAHDDDYLDRDTFAIATDATTNELTIRLDWADPVDLDYALFEQGSFAPVAISNTASVHGGELQTFAVRPGTPYWLWVGRHDGPPTGSPAAYTATMCATHFFH